MNAILGTNLIYYIYSDIDRYDEVLGKENLYAIKRIIPNYIEKQKSYFPIYEMEGEKLLYIYI